MPQKRKPGDPGERMAVKQPQKALNRHSARSSAYEPCTTQRVNQPEYVAFFDRRTNKRFFKIESLN